MANTGAAKRVCNFVKYRVSYVGEIVLCNVVFRECYFLVRKVAGAQPLASVIQAKVPICQAMRLHEFERQPLHILFALGNMKNIVTSGVDWQSNWQL